MGNRAVITTESKKIGVYLHWNGGRDSVEGFLKYCKLKGYRPPETDSYGWARLCQVIGNYFGGSTSIGIGNYHNNEEDNGTYIIKNWEIVDRKHFNGTEQKEYPLKEFLEDVNEKQPKREQIDLKEVEL